jgi:hypothetical protein
MDLLPAGAVDEGAVHEDDREGRRADCPGARNDMGHVSSF